MIQPFKHYDSVAIQSVLDGAETAKMCAADDSTIRRWQKSYGEAESDIAQRLASIHSRSGDKPVPIHVPAMRYATIRGAVAGWLAFVMTLLINSGHKLCTQFAFCPPASSVRVNTIRVAEGTGGRKNDKTVDDTS